MSASPLPGRAEDIERLWLDYQRACGVQVAGFSASALGHSRALADELAALVAAGSKRAHATLRRDFQQDLEPLPQDLEDIVLEEQQGLSAHTSPLALVRISPLQVKSSTRGLPTISSASPSLRFHRCHLPNSLKQQD